MLAADTETTGLYIHHGCRPFYFSGCDHDGNHFSKEWDVNPETRIPKIPKGDVVEVSDYLNSDPDGVCFQNIKFDLHALRKIGVKLPPWKKLHCTLTMMHALDSDEPHDLKGMAAKYFNYPIGDEKELIEAVTKARRLIKKFAKLDTHKLLRDWQIAHTDHPHFRPTRSKAKQGNLSPHSDYFLPRTLAVYNQALPPEKKILTPEEESHFLTVCSKYADSDAERTILLAIMAEEELKSQGLWKGYLLNRQALCVAFSMEKRGVHIHVPILKREIARISKRAEEEFASAEQIAKKELGVPSFNLDSPKQLQKLIFFNWNLPVNKLTKTGQPSTDFDALMSLAFSKDETIGPRPRKFLKHLMTGKKFDKAAQAERSFEAYRVDNYIHGNINVTGTKTTRMSINDPGLQTAAKDREQSEHENEEIKEFLDELYHGELNPRLIFGPPDGYLWYAIDYNQLQLRIFGSVSEETKLIEAFRNGWKAHDFMAHEIYTRLKQLKKGEKPNKQQKRVGKAVNFGYIFGASEEKIDKTAGIPGLLKTVNQMFPNAHGYMSRTKRQAYRDKSVMVAELYRLMCDRPHKAVNYKVQGLEGLIVKKAMVDCHRYLLKNDPDSFLTLQIHDELVFQVPKPYDFDENDFTEDDCPHLSQICKYMVDAGAYFGVETPVSPEVITTSWNRGIPVSVKTALA